MCSVLRYDLNVMYRRIKKIPFHGNRTRCLVLRQQYAMFMLHQLSEGKRVINIDQSWLNETQFVRRCWRKRGEPNTMSQWAMNPRISVLMAIDTAGELYWALTQVNTDTKIFCLFMQKLANKLGQQDKRWRDNTIILIDGAKYQTNKESVSYMMALGFRVCISAPYSYASSPIEYAFGYFKSVDLNPSKLKTGKK